MEITFLFHFGCSVLGHLSFNFGSLTPWKLKKITQKNDAETKLLQPGSNSSQSYHAKWQLHYICLWFCHNKLMQGVVRDIGIYALLSSKSIGIWKLSQCVPPSLVKQHCFKFCYLIINFYGSYNFWAKIMVQNCYRCSYSCFSVNQCLAWLAVEGRNACKLIDLVKELFFLIFSLLSQLEIRERWRWKIGNIGSGKRNTRVLVPSFPNSKTWAYPQQFTNECK